MRQAIKVDEQYCCKCHEPIDQSATIEELLEGSNGFCRTCRMTLPLDGTRGKARIGKDRMDVISLFQADDHLQSWFSQMVQLENEEALFALLHQGLKQARCPSSECGRMRIVTDETISRFETIIPVLERLNFQVEDSITRLHSKRLFPQKREAALFFFTPVSLEIALAQAQLVNAKRVLFFQMKESDKEKIELKWLFRQRQKFMNFISELL